MPDKNIDLAKQLGQTPIDFPQLIKDGVLRRQGAWYEVLDWERLPDHALQKVYARQAPNLVKFHSHPAKFK